LTLNGDSLSHELQHRIQATPCTQQMKDGMRGALRKPNLMPENL
jgi:hypothetical protein